ncbi:sigma-54-dependent Fis family transcriptional regulator [Mycobacterium sp. 050134]|uniref:sigma-54-dependent Fis family transcriptional regulator n=1 Tax=Mycobacterium sp. 050134 TaxID=3096111 RepID=UPI002ED83CB7
MDPEPDPVAQVLRARRQFLRTGSLQGRGIREDILHSWRRSRSLRVHPDRVGLPYVRQPRTDSELVTAAAPILRRIADDIAGQPVCVILTTAQGVVLQRLGGDAELVEALDAVRLVPGYSFAEKFAGTNGIGTTLELAQPTYIEGAEHYMAPLGRLTCAAAPIRDPSTHRVAGVVDLTGFADQSTPLLYALAKSTAKQIEDRMRLLARESETALLEAYLQHCRRYPHGVLAVGGDVVLMNRQLRHTLEVNDRTALSERASEFRATAVVGAALTVELPSGATARLRAVHRSPGRRGGENFVYQVRVDAGAERSAPARIPGLAGTSSAWRHAAQQALRCCREREWLLLGGESGSGRSTLARAVARHVRPERTVRVLSCRTLDAEQVFAELEAVTAGTDFAVVLADLDHIDGAALEPIAGLLRSRAGHGWLAATVGPGTPSAAVEALLPVFPRTVGVPALRHRIEDLDDLVPLLLCELTRGAAVRLHPEAMSQLRKLPWPGNVAQLREVLARTVATQRSGVIPARRLPPECWSVSKRTLSRIEALERDAIVRSLLENGGNKADAAEALGMSRATIYRKINEYGIS